MRALVTGAAGFVGGHLVAHLEAAGDEVTATDRASGGADLGDPAGLDHEMAAAAPEVVYHLAGQADVGGSWDDPTGTLRANAEGTLNVLTAARHHGVRRVVTVSSADLYGIVGPADLPIGEDAPLRPVSPYGASKAAADLIALQAFLGHHQDVVRVRAFNHLGPGQDDRFVCSALAARIAANELTGADVVAVGNLEARRDFTDVRDVVRAYRCLAMDGTAGAAYNVCTGTSLAVRDVADLLVSMAERPMRLEDDPALHRPTDLPDLRGDPARIHHDTGWTPHIGLEQTLADLLADWRRRLRERSPAHWSHD